MTFESLLHEREFRGLRISLWVHLVLAGLILANQVFLFRGGQTPWVLAVPLTMAAVVLVLLRLLTPERTTLVGSTLVAIDAAMMVAVPFLWWAWLGHPSTSRAYLILMPTVGVTAVFVALSALPLRPLYTGLTGATAIAAQVVLHYWIVADPRVQISSLNAFADSIVHYPIERLQGGILIVALVTLALVAATAMARRLTLEWARDEQQRSQLARYFSPAVANQIQAGDEASGIASAEREVAVMMTDIRGFTALTARQGAAAAVSLLADYFGRLVPVVFAHNGTVDKFVGDSILAVFGAPRTSGHDADDALAAAREMNIAMAAWNAERAARGEAAVRHVVALHAGPVIAGNIGSAERLEYTVIGDTVNGASRILEVAKELDAPLLVTQAFLDRLSRRPASLAAHTRSLRGLGRRKLYAIAEEASDARNGAAGSA